MEGNIKVCTLKQTSTGMDVQTLAQAENIPNLEEAQTENESTLVVSPENIIKDEDKVQCEDMEKTVKVDKDIEEAELTHKQVMDVVRTSLHDILQDPLLCDLPSDVTTEEINLQLALEYGQAMTVNVRKQDGEVLRKCHLLKAYGCCFYLYPS